MKHVKLFLAVVTVLVVAVVPAFAQEVVPNPSTGDNSVVAIALVVMGIAGVAIAAVLLMGKKGKGKGKKKNPIDKI